MNELLEIIKKLSKNLSEENNNQNDSATIFISVSSIVSNCELESMLNKIKQFETEKNVIIKIKEIGSFGIYSIEPVVGIQLPNKAILFYGNVSSDSLSALLDAVFSHWVIHSNLLGQLHLEKTELWDGVENLKLKSWFNFQNRFLTELCGLYNPVNLKDAIDAGRFHTFVHILKNIPREESLNIIKKSKLKGRSGNGFYTHLKWENLFKSISEQRYLICNAFGSNPSSYTSRLLTESDPFVVLESVMLASYILSCNKSYIVVPYHYELSIKRLNKAKEQLYESGLLGYDILKSGFNLDLHIFEAPGAYISGEETAIISSIEGKRATPNEKPPYPVQKGLFGKATIVNNIETLVTALHVIKYGEQWFKSFGDEKGYGTKLFSVSGAGVLHGVYEFPLGITLEELWNKVRIENKILKGAFIGGPIGRIFPTDKFSEIKLNFPNNVDKNNDNSFIGDGTVIFIEDSVCLVDFVKNELDFIRRESCGKCLPCREGSKRLWNIFNLLTNKPVDEKSAETLIRIKEIIRTKEIVQTVEQTALCGLGKRFPQLITDLLDYFKDEVEEHLFDRYCRAIVCRNLRTYTIETTLCNGCNICMQKCPHEAIIGLLHSQHYIIQNKCTSCGICYKVCKFGAISYK
jgi:NADH:ubiquinone oxidoreductase subunit F (NADH-binding)